MPRPYLLPDPNDRSVNEPKAIMSGPQVLGLYNQDSGEEKKSRVVDSVKAWLEKTARGAGWSSVEFSGNQAVLTAKVSLNNK